MAHSANATMESLASSSGGAGAGLAIPLYIQVDLSSWPVKITTSHGNSFLRGLPLHRSIVIQVIIILRDKSASLMKLEFLATLVDQALYIGLPHGFLPEECKDAFMALLKYSEEILGCIRMVVYFPRHMLEREALYRRLEFLGLIDISWESSLLHLPDPGNIYMIYELGEQ